MPKEPPVTVSDLKEKDLIDQDREAAWLDEIEAAGESIIGMKG